MYDAIVHSCDVYFYNLGNELGIDQDLAVCLAWRSGPEDRRGFARRNCGLIPSQKLEPACEESQVVAD